MTRRTGGVLVRFPWRSFLIVLIATLLSMPWLTPDWPQQLGNAMLSAAVLAAFAGLFWVLQRVYASHSRGIHGWAFARRKKAPLMSIVVVVVVGCVVGGLVSAGMWAWLSRPPESKPTALAVDYSILPGPIFQAPGSILHFLAVQPVDGSVGLSTVHTFGNAGDHVKYNTSVPDQPFTLRYLCVVHNRGDDRLLNIVLPFEVRFFDGPSHLGKVSARRNYTITVPLLSKDERFEFYIVNDSSLAATVDTPTHGSVTIYGSDHSQDATLLRSKSGNMDNWDQLPLAPKLPTP